MEECIEKIWLVLDNIISQSEEKSAQNHIVQNGMVDLLNNLSTNQRIMSNDLLQSHEEILTNKKFIEAKVSELIKDRIEHDRERRNCVIWDLDIHSLRKYSKLKSDHDVITAFAYDFIRKYLGSIDRRDFKAKRLGIDNEEKKKKYFRLLVTFTDVSLAQRLIGRCLHEGFRKIRSGLTKLERDLIFQTKRKVVELNSDLDSNSDLMFVRKHVYDILKVNRSHHIQEIEILDENPVRSTVTRRKPILAKSRVTRSKVINKKLKTAAYKQPPRSPLPIFNVNRLPPVGD